MVYHRTYPLSLTGRSIAGYLHQTFHFDVFFVWLVLRRVPSPNGSHCGVVEIIAKRHLTRACEIFRFITNFSPGTFSAAYGSKCYLTFTSTPFHSAPCWHQRIHIAKPPFSPRTPNFAICPCIYDSLFSLNLSIPGSHPHSSSYMKEMRRRLLYCTKYFNDSSYKPRNRPWQSPMWEADRNIKAPIQIGLNN